MKSVIVKDMRRGGRLCVFPEQLLHTAPHFIEVNKEELEDAKSYKELKEEAKEKGLEFKGNIKKEELLDLLSE